MQTMKYIALNLIIIFVFSGCYTSSYYLSPYNANSNAYKTLPRQCDSNQHAWYAAGNIVAGNANAGQVDKTFYAAAHLYKAFKAGKYIQSYIGANVNAGSYKVQQNDNAVFIRPYNSFLNNSGFGKKNFSGVGINAGVHATISIDKFAEWRIIGLETSLQQEFGDYLAFRKNLSDTSAKIIARSSFYSTLGFTSELIVGDAKQYLSLRTAAGTSLNRYKNKYNIYTLQPLYFSNSMAYTYQQLTLYIQLNIGSRAKSFQSGINVKLAKN
jgi:hypothetical protein